MPTPTPVPATLGFQTLYQPLGPTLAFEVGRAFSTAVASRVLEVVCPFCGDDRAKVINMYEGARGKPSSAESRVVYTALVCFACERPPMGVFAAPPAPPAGETAHPTRPTQPAPRGA